MHATPESAHSDVDVYVCACVLFQVVQVCTPSSMSWVTVEMERWFHLPFSRLNCRDGQPAVKLEWPWQFYR